MPHFALVSFRYGLRRAREARVASTTASVEQTLSHYYSRRKLTSPAFIVDFQRERCYALDALCQCTAGRDLQCCCKWRILQDQKSLAEFPS